MTRSLNLSLFALAFACLALGCADEEGNPEDSRTPPAEDHARTYERLLVQEGIETEGWGEEEDPCAGLCAPDLCGYNCGVAGEQCTRACAQGDSREQVFVTFDTSLQLPEDEIPEPDPESMDPPVTTLVIDTRAFPYLERISLWHTLVYGCDLWDFSDGETDGLEIEASALRHAAADFGEPRETGFEFEAYIEPFTGPGMYTGYGFFSRDSEARAAGDFYYSEEGCTFSLTSNGSGGIVGTFECTLEHNLGTEPPMQIANGEMSCGSNSLDLPQSILWPYVIDYATEAPQEEEMMDEMMP